MRLVWLPEAQADIQRLYNFLRARDPRAAERAIRTMQLDAQRLLEFPQLERRMDDETERRAASVPLALGRMSGATACMMRRL